MSPRRLTPLALVLLALAANADAGVIRGTVAVPAAAARPAPPLTPYPGNAAALPQAPAIERGRVTDAGVYGARVPVAAESALAARPAPRARLAQKDEAFQPRVVPVARGAAVDFPNLDPIYHNVFSLSPARRFDLGTYRQGRSKSVVFDRPGLVKVFCDIHADMEAFVLVLPHGAFAQPRPDGSFALPDLPPGAYELRVWHPDLPEIARAVEIPAAGDVRVELRF